MTMNPMNWLIVASIMTMVLMSVNLSR